MRKKIISILSVCTLAFVGLGVGLQSVDTVAEENAIYVSASGSDLNDGSYLTPFATLDKALTEVENGGTVILKDTVTLDSWTAHGKSLTITGGGLDVSGQTEVEINDSVTFTNMSWTVDSGAFVYANGYQTTIGENVSFSNEIRLFGGGKAGTTIKSTDLTVLSGTYTHVYGGSYQGTVTGNTNLTVGGTVNNSSAVDTAIKNHSAKYYIFGGGHTTNVVQGSTNVTIQDNAKAVYVFGGTHGLDGTIRQGTNLTVTGGTMMGVYGGSQGGDVGGNATTLIQGGTIQQVFGGNEGWPFRTGDVDLRVLGGTVSRRIYGGCYNDTEGFISLSFKTNYSVSGKISLTLGGGANISYSSSDADKGVYARSRYNQDIENTELVFADEKAYNDYTNGKLKVTAQDSTMKRLMNGLTVADELHYYTYEESGDVITQACVYHTEQIATATVELDESVSLIYTGEEIKPVKLSVSEGWEYDKPTLLYKNNVEIGCAEYVVSVGQLDIEGEFTIVETPTVLGASVRLLEPSGLRFQSKVAKELVDSGVTLGTLIIPKEVLGDNTLTVDTPTVNNVLQTKWATEQVKEQNPDGYEENYEYFNAVLTNIPETHYGTVIVARSYVYANGQYYYSDTIERSIAYVAAAALKNGESDEALYHYVDKALADCELILQSKVSVYEKQSYQLSLTGNRGYAVVWSTDSELISIDDNGKITAGKTEGEAVVTATIGSRTLQCIVIVQYRWTGYY